MRSALKGKAGRMTAALVALLAVVVLTSAALASAQADRPAAVTGLQASTGADGEIDVSWDAHPQTVKDYRVTWAKTGEDFRKWYVSGYSAFPTDTEHSITGLDDGEDYKVRVRARFDQGKPSHWSSTLSVAAGGAAPTPANEAPTGLPVITGTVQVGETLTADTSGISDANGLTGVSYTYQWLRNDGSTDTNITGATGQSYTLTDDDLNKAIKVSVTFTDDDGYTATLTSAATGSVARPANQAPTGLPTITGTVQVGETLTADTSAISDGNGLTSVSYSYQWIRNDGNSDTVITGATGSTYVLTADDAGKAIKAQVGFTDDDGYTATLTSAATGSVARPPNEAPSGQPTITGMAQVGETLSADTSGISDANGLNTVSYSYQWIRNDGNSDADIPGATAQTYTLTSDDQGNTVKVKVTFTDDDGYEEALTSASTVAVSGGSVSRASQGSSTTRQDDTTPPTLKVGHRERDLAGPDLRRDARLRLYAGCQRLLRHGCRHVGRSVQRRDQRLVRHPDVGDGGNRRAVSHRGLHRPDRDGRHTRAGRSRQRRRRAEQRAGVQPARPAGPGHHHDRRTITV